MLNVSGASISGLLLWIARYFNRRVHEDNHLKEEYEHRQILFNVFAGYSNSIISLSKNDTTPLLDLIVKTSNTINKSPANSLNRKKGDNIPVTEVLEIIERIQKNSNNSNGN